MVGETTKSKVLVKEKISEAGIDLLRKDFEVDVDTGMSDEELTSRINEYDALIVRSQTQVTADMLEKSSRLKVIGRAGSGVDNIDVVAATKRGILVANAPESNAVAAGEHAIALMLAQARQLPQAHSSLKAGKWERSKFKGVEITGKTLGLIGLGRIGLVVAQRARGLRMEVIGYDPYVSIDRFRENGIEAAESPDEVYAKADFITVHLPKNAETMGYIGDEEFAKMKDGVRIINAARGGIIDEEALVRAVESGKVASAGVDVFSKEPAPPDHPLLKYDNIVVTPHLGASTEEAQDKAGVIIAQQVAAALHNRFVSNAVNVPAIPDEAMQVLGPYLPLSETLGRLLVSIADGPLNKITVTTAGEIAEHDTKLITLSVLKGIFEHHVEEPVNIVNAGAIADERGLDVTEVSERRSRDYTNLITVETRDRRGPLTVAGTTIGPKHKPRLVKIYRHDIDLEPAEHMAFFQYEDVPGMIGKVGTALGKRGINIAFMNVGRKKVEGKAVMGVALDERLPQETLDEICALDGFFEARSVEL